MGTLRGQEGPRLALSRDGVSGIKPGPFHQGDTGSKPLGAVLVWFSAWFFVALPVIGVCACFSRAHQKPYRRVLFALLQVIQGKQLCHGWSRRLLRAPPPGLSFSLGLAVPHSVPRCLTAPQMSLFLRRPQGPQTPVSSHFSC